MAELSELGLSDAVVEAARAAGYEQATPLQVAAVPVLRRGSNVVLHAASGAGVTAAFGMPLLERLSSSDERTGVRALIITPTGERAAAVAEGLAALAGTSGAAVRTPGPGWRLTGADVLVTTVAQALRLVQDSTLKLESVQTLVITDAAELFGLDQGEPLETLISLVPREAQRVVTTAELSDAVEKLVEAHARRALTIPGRPADPREAPAQESIGQIGYVVVQERDKPAMLARLLETVDEHAVVFTRTGKRAGEVQRELQRRGIMGADDNIRVVAFGHTPAADVVRVISYDVPFSAEQLRANHVQGGTVLITPPELTHLRRIAAEMRFTLKHRRARELERDAVDAFRATIRAALNTEDLSAQLLVLEPLLAEHSAEEVASALSALLRRRPSATASASEAAPAAPASAARPSAPATFTRLFVSIGTRDNVRPGDLVGAITGEAGIKGDQVGRVDIRDTFSVVEIAASVADKVIRALNGTTMRGRSLRVDYDRKSGVANEERRGPPRAARSGSGADRPPRERTPRKEPPRDRTTGPRRGPRER